MATSNSIDFNLNRNQIIRLALQGINLIGDEDDVDDSTFAVANNFLNTMVKAWQGEGCKIWARREGILFPAYNQNKYTLSSTGDNATTSYVSTLSSVAANLGSSTITLTSVTGMTAADYIGIELDDGTRQWTTISSINGLIITLGTTLTDAVAAGNTVVTYTTKINRPIAIPNARRFNLISSVETPLTIKNHTEYFNLSNKSSPGSINTCYYEPQLNSGNLYVWQTPSAVQDILKFTHYPSIQDFDSATDYPDFPCEWLDALVKNLQVPLCIRYEMFSKYSAIKAEAQEAKDTAMASDSEYSSIKFALSTNR